MYDIDLTFGPSAFDYTRLIASSNQPMWKSFPQRLTWPYTLHDYYDDDYDYNKHFCNNCENFF